VDAPKDWVRAVNEPMSAKEQERVETSIRRSRPFGDEAWQERTAKRLGLTASLRSEGRPKEAKRDAKKPEK
jgi:hypothetical protein